MTEQTTEQTTAVTLRCPNCGRILEVEPERTKPLRCGSYAERAGCLIWLELRGDVLVPIPTPPRSQR